VAKYYCGCYSCWDGSSKKKFIKERLLKRDAKEQMEDEPDRRTGPDC
jgi:hypothetical protein